MKLGIHLSEEMFMKKILLFAFLLTASTGAIAEGFYTFIPYYNNDPFTFCTYGVPEDCWLPVNAATGTYIVTYTYCFNETSASLYHEVCPKAFPYGLGAASMKAQHPRRQVAVRA